MTVRDCDVALDAAPAAPVNGRAPFLSVVIPTHNRSELLVRAVRSVFASLSADDVPAVEVIVADDGSSEDIGRAIEQSGHGELVRVVRQEQAGAAAARNTGARSARGDVLLFLDSDDELLPGAVEAFRAAFAKGGVGLGCSSAVTVHPDGSTTANRLRPLGPAYENQRGLFLAGTFAVRREVFEAIGGFAEGCRSSQHTEFSLRAIPYCRRAGLKVAVVERATVRIYAHAGEHLRSSFHRLLAGALYIIEQHREQLLKSPKHYADWCSVGAVYAAKLGQFGVARRLLRQGLRASPRRPRDVMRLGLTCVPAIARQVWRLPMTSRTDDALPSDTHDEDVARNGAKERVSH